MNNIIKFYDTCALLEMGEQLFEEGGEYFILSNITLKELEHIKTSANKDPDIKYSARLLLRLLENYPDKWNIVLHKLDYEIPLINLGFEINNDLKILSDAIFYQQQNIDKFKIEFVTNDLSLKNIAVSCFEGLVSSTTGEKDTDISYGYKEFIPSKDDLAYFYEHPQENIFNLLVNEYLILKNSEDKVIDIRCWTGTEYRYLKSSPFVSKWFGKMQPYNNDIYQQIYCDSLCNNSITMVRGPAGSGKSSLALGYLMHQMDKGKIDKIIIFCNTVATIDSAKLGFYPGTRDQKLLDSQIGNFLTSKFGSQDAVEALIEDGRLMLLPLSDIRGFDTNGMNAGIYITEAQNLSRTLMKLALQRIGEDCICIIDGDNTQQVDSKAFSGANNGMRALSKVFRGENIYGEIELKNIYRGKIARIADKIKII